MASPAESDEAHERSYLEQWLKGGEANGPPHTCDCSNDAIAALLRELGQVEGAVKGTVVPLSSAEACAWSNLLALLSDKGLTPPTDVADDSEADISELASQVPPWSATVKQIVDERDADLHAATDEDAAIVGLLLAENYEELRELLKLTDPTRRPWDPVLVLDDSQALTALLSGTWEREDIATVNARDDAVAKIQAKKDAEEWQTIVAEVERDEAATKPAKKERDPKELHVEECRTAFKTFDVDKSGFIDLHEFGMVMSYLGHMLSDEELKKKMDEIDANGDGKLDFDEFMVIMEKRVEDAKEEQLIKKARAAYAHADLDGSGEIDSHEFSLALSCLGYSSLNQEQIQALFDEMDVDGDGTLAFPEFLCLARKTVAERGEDTLNALANEEVTRKHRSPPAPATDQEEDDAMVLLLKVISDSPLDAPLSAEDEQRRATMKDERDAARRRKAAAQAAIEEAKRERAEAAEAKRIAEERLAKEEALSLLHHQDFVNARAEAQKREIAEKRRVRQEKEKDYMRQLAKDRAAAEKEKTKAAAQAEAAAKELNPSLQAASVTGLLTVLQGGELLSLHKAAVASLTVMLKAAGNMATDKKGVLTKILDAVKTTTHLATTMQHATAELPGPKGAELHQLGQKLAALTTLMKKSAVAYATKPAERALKDKFMGDVKNVILTCQSAKEKIKAIVADETGGKAQHGASTPQAQTATIAVKQEAAAPVMSPPAPVAQASSASASKISPEELKNIEASHKSCITAVGVMIKADRLALTNKKAALTAVIHAIKAVDAHATVVTANTATLPDKFAAAMGKAVEKLRASSNAVKSAAIAHGKNPGDKPLKDAFISETTKLATALNSLLKVTKTLAKS